MHCETLRYSADGLNLIGSLYVGKSSGSKRPGVLVFPEAFGLSEHARERARRIAGLGYVALACDLHGDARLYEDLDAVMPLVGALRREPERIRSRARAALETLAARSDVDATRMAAIGFCFGGTMALELARSGAEIAGVVGFHSALSTASAADARNIRGKVLVCLGADDPMIDAAQREAFIDEMRGARINWQMSLYGGAVHAFTNPAADAIGRPEFARYDAQADTRSWADMKRFFDELFGACK